MGKEGQMRIRRQSPVKGGRHPLPACVLKSIERRIRELAWQHRVSRSWVVSVILAKALNINDQEHYDGK